MFAAIKASLIKNNRLLIIPVKGKELIRQFNEVRQLNAKLSKPVLHITLSFAPGEQLHRKYLWQHSGWPGGSGNGETSV